MRYHSLILDDFFRKPQTTRELILSQPLNDHVASDGVKYPGIIYLPDPVQDEILANLNFIFKARISETLMFARLSSEHMKPPHWAHSDWEMAQYVGLCYMSPVDHGWDGTHLVRHKELGFETHPSNEAELHALIEDANDKLKWDITFTCPSKFNRMFIVDARYLHAAAGRFGVGTDDSRLVCTAFFRLK